MQHFYFCFGLDMPKKEADFKEGVCFFSYILKSDQCVLWFKVSYKKEKKIV